MDTPICINKYCGQVDAVLFSPPYYDLEIYSDGEQSFARDGNFEDLWLFERS